MTKPIRNLIPEQTSGPNAGIILRQLTNGAYFAEIRNNAHTGSWRTERFTSPAAALDWLASHEWTQRRAGYDRRRREIAQRAAS